MFAPHWGEPQLQRRWPTSLAWHLVGLVSGALAAGEIVGLDSFFEFMLFVFGNEPPADGQRRDEQQSLWIARAALVFRFRFERVRDGLELLGIRLGDRVHQAANELANVGGIHAHRDG